MSPLNTPLGDSMEPPIHDEKGLGTYEPPARRVVRSRHTGRQLDGLRSVHRDVGAQEELGGLDLHGERSVQGVKLGISSSRERIHNEAIVHVHDYVHARAVREMLPEVARIVLRLFELLNANQLLNEGTIPNAAGVRLTVKRGPCCILTPKLVPH